MILICLNGAIGCNCSLFSTVNRPQSLINVAIVFLRSKSDCSKLDFFPSLNNAGRYRVDYNLDANIEVFRDFYIGGTFYYSFDNKPASDGAANDDYGFSTTLGYSFHK